MSHNNTIIIYVQFSPDWIFLVLCFSWSRDEKSFSDWRTKVYRCGGTQIGGEAAAASVTAVDHISSDCNDEMMRSSVWAHRHTSDWRAETVLPAARPRQSQAVDQIHPVN